MTDTRHTLNVEKRIGFSRLVIGSALIGAGMALSASGPGLAWAQVRSRSRISVVLNMSVDKDIS